MSNMTTEIRSLRLAVLEQQKQMGELLVSAARKIPDHNLITVIMEKHAISPDDAMACIVLHLHWTDFKMAEQWHYDHGYHTPNTPEHAILLVQRWHKHGRPVRVIPQ